MVLEVLEDKKIYKSLMIIKNNDKLANTEKIDKAYDLLSVKGYRFLDAHDIVNEIFR